MSEPGPMLARGRSADVYDIGDGRVLRRHRTGLVSEAEVTAMTAAHRHGFPVPEIFDVDGPDMVMERVSGTDHLSLLTRRPWQARRVGRILADLHHRIRDVPIDGLGLRPLGPPADVLVHGDLHPGNVLASPDGPVVIDWEGCGTGPRDADVAATWVLMSIADPDDVPFLVRPLVSRVRSGLVDAFMGAVGAPSAETVVTVCDLRLRDANMSEAERDRIKRFRAGYE